MSNSNINVSGKINFGVKNHGSMWASEGETKVSNIEAGSQEFKLNRGDYDWQPKEDITTYELAQCTPLLIGMITMGSYLKVWQNAIEELPEECQRHFVITDLPKISVGPSGIYYDAIGSNENFKPE